ncbi:putative chip protein (carboxyl terminus of hsc70-interacting protein) [Diaporthe ampelina]|uniref:E3 ubiquitin-protein ligase CHIP n=1 Tax=Diaporthe ampelina TaxID=1214573 RepID=A0A0G2HFV2_9PEZI|nr:putative chip protein (carboxyl terminus of hsc70-interacting protein) [Diaporthe ampelina]
MAVQEAAALKEQGNKRFARGDYGGAEGLYSQAIIADPKDPKIYTNRALARIRLQRWEDAILDCQTCLAFSSDNMKAHFLIAQAQIELKYFDDALQNVKRAHELAAKTGDKSLGAITQLVLRCKKERWEDRERRRLRESSALEREVLEMLERERAQAQADCMDESELKDVAADWDAKIADMRRTFQLARGEQGKRREVPDWAVDDITFGILVDPVITKTGKSYERASILEHLKRSKTDPVTREPLDPSDLRPNLDLRDACEDFLENNGWAVDW